MKKIKLSIPDMQSAHCQSRVQQAISAVEGATINELKPGAATVSVADALQQTNITNAVEKAGYTVSGIETESTGTANDTLTFKTNINCGGCVASVKPGLDDNSGIAGWNVDTAHKDKILTVTSAGATAEDVMDTIKKAGFKIEPLA